MQDRRDTGGIITECNDSDPKYGHCFQIVGYGSENGQDYWKVRNSWGTDYGENGFVRVASITGRSTSNI